MKCQITAGNPIVVSNVDNPSQFLNLEVSPFYCRLFENTQQQSRDYLEEIIRWTDDNVENYEYLSTNLLHCTAAIRRQYGFKK